MRWPRSPSDGAWPWGGVKVLPGGASLPSLREERARPAAASKNKCRWLVIGEGQPRELSGLETPLCHGTAGWDWELAVLLRRCFSLREWEEEILPFGKRRMPVP